jgi:hypothetical protein
MQKGKGSFEDSSLHHGRWDEENTSTRVSCAKAGMKGNGAICFERRAGVRDTRETGRARKATYTCATSSNTKALCEKVEAK